jgi:hypothetical protein
MPVAPVMSAVGMAVVVVVFGFFGTMFWWLSGCSKRKKGLEANKAAGIKGCKWSAPNG